ncbi:MAG TPA: hypothetical protein VLG28_01200 [Acidimicrobiia bacterium]|nr:hypothetical protein [Acidimicrobiia bacterium]
MPGAIRPTRRIFALLLVVVLSAVWFSAITLWVKRTDADERVLSLD